MAEAGKKQDEHVSLIRQILRTDADFRRKCSCLIAELVEGWADTDVEDTLVVYADAGEGRHVDSQPAAALTGFICDTASRLTATAIDTVAEVSAEQVTQPQVVIEAVEGLAEEVTGTAIADAPSPVADAVCNINNSVSMSNAIVRTASMYLRQPEVETVLRRYAGSF